MPSITNPSVFLTKSNVSGPPSVGVVDVGMVRFSGVILPVINAGGGSTVVSVSSGASTGDLVFQEGGQLASLTRFAGNKAYQLLRYSDSAADAVVLTSESSLEAVSLVGVPDGPSPVG